MSSAVSTIQVQDEAGTQEQDRVQDMLQHALDTLQGMIDGEYQAGVVHATLAGLETAVVVVETTGGLVPVFVHVNGNLAPLLRNHLGELPRALEGGLPLLAS